MGNTLLITLVGRKKIDESICIDFTKFMVKYGADVNCMDRSGRTPFMITVYWGYEELAKSLFRLGAIPDTVTNKERTSPLTPLIGSVIRNNYELFVFILSNCKINIEQSV